MAELALVRFSISIERHFLLGVMSDTELPLSAQSFTSQASLTWLAGDGISNRNEAEAQKCFLQFSLQVMLPLSYARYFKKRYCT